MNAKRFRLSRLNWLKNQKSCIVPIDHGTTLGPICGLEDSVGIVRKILQGNADGIVLHKGLLSRINEYVEFDKANFIMHMSVSTALGNDPTEKVLVASVEEALQLGAAAVSVHVNLGTDTECAMIRDFACVSEKCLMWGMPLLAMIYSHRKNNILKEIKHAARLGEELGADIVKVDYPGSVEMMKEVTSCVNIPVLISGGKKKEKLEDLIIDVKEAIRGGANGISIGRNIFQHEDPKQATIMLSALVKENISSYVIEGEEVKFLES